MNMNRFLVRSLFMALIASAIPANAANTTLPFRVTFDGAYSTYEPTGVPVPPGRAPDQIPVIVADPLKFYAPTFSTAAQLNGGSLDLFMEGYGILVRSQYGSFDLQSIDLRTLSANHPSISLYVYDYDHTPTFPLSFTPPVPDRLISFSLTTSMKTYDLNIRNVGSMIIYNTMGSYSLDNITGVSGVPEPATWAMMVLGLSAVGFAMRRRAKGVTTTVKFA